MELTTKQKERINAYLRFGVVLLGAATMLSFSHFLVLINLGGFIFPIAIVFGIVIGMMNTEIHLAIMNGLLGYMVSIALFIVIILVPIVFSASFILSDILILGGIDAIVRAIVPHTLGIFIGTPIGRFLGPDWFPAIEKHKLRVPLPSEEKGE
jgi:hypothetical protein